MQVVATMWPVLCLMCSLVAVGEPYEHGPPIDDTVNNVCRDMFPTGHGAEAQATDPELFFTVGVSGDCYKTDTELHVTYHSINQSKDIEGIFFQARTYVNSNRGAQSVGVFRVTDPVLEPLACNDIDKSAAAHNKEVKNLSRSFYWKAGGDDLEDDIRFYATVVIHKQEFWTFVPSSIIPRCGSDQAAKKSAGPRAGPASGGAGLLLLSIFIIGLRASMPM